MKQTEIGMIPDDWEVKELREVCTTSSGGTPSRNNKQNYIGNIKWFTTSELKDCYLYDSNEHISLSALSNSSAKLFPPETILIAMYGATIGKLGILKVEASTNQACCGIFCKNVNLYFLYHYLKFNRNNIVSQGSGAGQPNISQNTVKKIQIPLPPTLAEQQKIAKSLSDVDNVISTLEKLIAKKKNLKQGTMQQLLTGKKRLPGFAKSDKFKQTEIGEIPEDWEVKSFEELFDICTSTINIKQINPKLYVGTENMMQNRGGVSKTENELNYLNVREYKTEDILFSNIRPYLKKIWLADHNGGCSSDVLVFRHKNECDNPLFLYMLVSDDRFFQIVNDNAVGTKMPRGDKNIIRQIKFSLPSKPEQTAIANVLSSMDKEIEALNTKLEKYRNLKTGMMQQLLTGKIRLR